MGEKIGCVVAADHLIAASVSNWGGYALAAAAAAAKSGARDSQEKWIEHCLRTEGEEIKLLHRCTVAVGCRDGVSEKVEATVDGRPIETSLQCLRGIRKAALATGN
jgi:hypothetical protein